MALSEAARVTFRMNRAVNRAMKTFLQRSLEDLIDETPVRTGYAQSNWLVAVGSIPEGTAGSRDAVDYSAQQEGFRTIRAYKPSQGELIIYNNVSYIEQLNNGSSSQAPAGFVDDIFDRATKQVDRLVLR